MRAVGDDRAGLEERLDAWAQARSPVDAAAPGHERGPPGALIGAYPDRSAATVYDKELEVYADRERARFAAWYEMFPALAGPGARTRRHFRRC